MEVIIGLLLIWLVIYLVWQLLKALFQFTVWFTPYAFQGMILLLGLGCLIGLPMGIYQGIKCYMTSINKNITNSAMRVVMICVTSTALLFIFAYIAAITYYVFKLYF